MSEFRSIEIDFDVHKVIEIERRGFQESPNDVLRRLLKIKGSQPSADTVHGSNRGKLSGKGSVSSGQSSKRTSRWNKHRGQQQRKRVSGIKGLDEKYPDRNTSRQQGDKKGKGNRGRLDDDLSLGIIERFEDKSGRSWWGKGVELPHGTELRMRYNGSMFTGFIHNGGWMVEGRAYESPSAAAGGVAFTSGGEKTSLNGWRYWDVKRPSDANWIPINRLRQLG